MQEPRDIGELEELLRLERVEREAAQKRAATLSERVRLWRTRAEERAARIESLERERDQLRTPTGWLRATLGRAGSSQAAAGPAAAPMVPRSTAPSDDRPRSFPTVAVATVGSVDDQLALVIGECAVTAADGDLGALDAADLVVITGRGDGVEGLDDWLARPGRPPVLHPASIDLPGLGDGDVAFVREQAGGADRATGAWVMQTTFDVAAFSPARRVTADELVALDPGAVSGLEDGPDGPLLTAASGPDVAWVAAAMASGIRAAWDDAADRDRNGAMRRRAVFAERAPWRVAEAMLDVAGVGHESGDPTVASVLVSNRPERVEAAVAGVLAQTHRTRLVVGCHGFPADAVHRLLEGATVTDEPIVMEFDGSWPLGRCLNHAIASVPDPVIAKIDDDDHYGRAYLTDAVQALRYGGSSLVGKGAVFVYLEGRDTTYLRRPEVIERLHTGTPNGGTLVFRRGLWDAIPFPHRTVGEDVAFVEAAKRSGVIPYAPSPWEYVYRRGAGTNTWQAVDEVFLDGAVVAWSGDDPTRADL